MDETNAVLELGLLVLRRSLERTPEVIEDRDQLLDEALVRTLGQRRVLARVALAEVVELRCETLEPVEQLVALGLESGDLVAALFRTCLRDCPWDLLVCGAVVGP